MSKYEVSGYMDVRIRFRVWEDGETPEEARRRAEEKENEHEIILNTAIERREKRTITGIKAEKAEELDEEEWKQYEHF